MSVCIQTRVKVSVVVDIQQLLGHKRTNSEYDVGNFVGLSFRFDSPTFLWDEIFFKYIAIEKARQSKNRRPLTYFFTRVSWLCFKEELALRASSIVSSKRQLISK
jgi:hypothetical protein